MGWNIWNCIGKIPFSAEDESRRIHDGPAADPP